MRDRYATYAALARATREGAHWRIVSRERPSPMLVAAPHGGWTEPHTGVIARAIAGLRHSLYVFEALVPGLHVTSHRFSEPIALAQAGRHFKVLTVHGCNDNRSSIVDVFVGGRDRVARDAVIAELTRAGFNAAADTLTPGRARGNICNAGKSGAGVQLELTRRLRNLLGRPGAGAARRRAFVRAIRLALVGPPHRSDELKLRGE